MRNNLSGDFFVSIFSVCMSNSKSVLLSLLFAIVSGLPVAFTQENPGNQKNKVLAEGLSLTIHLRGVYEGKISLLPMAGTNALQPVVVEEGVKNNSTATMQVPADYLPGEFVVRFDYKEEASSTPYPSEKRMIIGYQNLEMWVHPMYANNSDSTWFQEGEQENAAFRRFMTENGKQKEILGLLQQFLLRYDDVSSDFYQEGIVEYEKRRKEHNKWIRRQIEQEKDLFVSSLFPFQLIPELQWEGTEEDRRQSAMDNYFDEIDLSNSLLVRTSQLNEWMDSYVNMYGELATSVALRDSLFTLAGKRAIEEAKNGHPLVYGWMVDYFFKGYESFNIQDGIAMLEPYMNDPACLTTKKLAIQKRLEGMETLVPGSVAPDFTFMNKEGEQTMFHSCKVDKPFKLVLFWSADCAHCLEMVNRLYPWYRKDNNSEKVEVFAISLDDTETEREAWQKIIVNMPEWRHIPTKGGVNSQEANDYYILATPVMILVDAATNGIVSMPENVEQLGEAIQK